MSSLPAFLFSFLPTVVVKRVFEAAALVSLRRFECVSRAHAHPRRHGRLDRAICSQLIAAKKTIDISDNGIKESCFKIAFQTKDIRPRLKVSNFSILVILTLFILT